MNAFRTPTLPANHVCKIRNGTRIRQYVATAVSPLCQLTSINIVHTVDTRFHLRRCYQITLPHSCDAVSVVTSLPSIMAPANSCDQRCGLDPADRFGTGLPTPCGRPASVGAWRGGRLFHPQKRNLHLPTRCFHPKAPSLDLAFVAAEDVCNCVVRMPWSYSNLFHRRSSPWCHVVFQKYFVTNTLQRYEEANLACGKTLAVPPGRVFPWRSVRKLTNHPLLITTIDNEIKALSRIADGHPVLCVVTNAAGEPSPD